MSAEIDEMMSEFFNTDKNVLAEKARLNWQVLGDDVDESTLGPEVLKLRTTYRKKGVEHFHVSLAPEFRGNAEDIARSLNRTDDWLADPVNNLISSIEGHLFLKKDTVMCLENAKQVVSYDPYFLPITMSKAEEQKVRDHKEDIVLFERAIEMIKDLAAKKGCDCA